MDGISASCSVSMPPPARRCRRRRRSGAASRCPTSGRPTVCVTSGSRSVRCSFPKGTTGFLAVFQDITELKRLEREARLQQRLSAVGDMAAGLAHEIRNPLASMAGSIELLRDELPLTTDQRQLMDIVLRESERLNQTIQLFLAYATRSAMHRIASTCGRCSTTPLSRSAPASTCGTRT